jgi:hypothetical protein
MTPAYRLWDPSQAVFFAFALFFARILSDVGYVAILGIASLALWTPMGAAKAAAAARRDVGADHFFARLRVLVGTYCGVEPPARSWLASVHLLDGQRPTLDDVDRDWLWSGASLLRQPGIRLVAPTFAHGNKPFRMGSHYSGRLERGARNKQSSWRKKG